MCHKVYGLQRIVLARTCTERKKTVPHPTALTILRLVIKYYFYGFKCENNYERYCTQKTVPSGSLNTSNLKKKIISLSENKNQKINSYNVPKTKRYAGKDISSVLCSYCN